MAPTSTAAPTTTLAPLPMPLTGLAATDPLSLLRRVLVVKIDNHPQARPQFGLNAADIVFEENVEGLTRFAAVFHSTDSERVGPIRSGRTQDVDLLGSFNRPLFAWSGGNAGTTAAIRASDLVDLGPFGPAASAYYRDRRAGESTEHTLYSSTTRLRELGPTDFSPPEAQFLYRSPADQPGGDISSRVDLAMDGVAVTWVWDESSGHYLRFQGGREHRDATLGQVSAANVVVLEVTYAPSPADLRSPEATTVGRGTVWVHTGGRLVAGTWSRADRRRPFTLLDANGLEIRLGTGRTWVELARPGSASWPS